MDVYFWGWAGWSDTGDNIVILKKIIERSVETTIKTLATKDDIANVRKEMGNGLSNLSKEMGVDLSNLRKEMGNDLSNFRKEMGEGNIKLHKDMAESRTENIKWMFFFAIADVCSTTFIFWWFLRK
jgi:hypothetical protein